VATHGHFDHVLAVVDLQLAYAIPFLIHHKDRFLLKRMSETAEHFLKIPIKIPIPVPDKTISKDQQVVAGSLTFEIIQTPGHTPGSISLYFKNEKTLFSGDTWFADGAVGRTDFSYASAKDLHLSLVRLSALPDSTRLFSGHGRASSVGDEKMNIKESI
jgi:glyoxylase-like metal-dependent hydrolase (beta-lactamase superfamily II)